MTKVIMTPLCFHIAFFGVLACEPEKSQIPAGHSSNCIPGSRSTSPCTCFLPDGPLEGYQECLTDGSGWGQCDCSACGIFEEKSPKPTLGTGYELQLYSVPANLLAEGIFELTTFTDDGGLLVVTRETNNGTAEHRIVSAKKCITDTILTDKNQYPDYETDRLGRMGTDIILDPIASTTRAFVVDAGTICVGLSGPSCTSSYPENANGRIFSLDLTTGNTNVIVDRGILFDPYAIAVDHSTNSIYLADRGTRDTPDDGRIAELSGNTVSTLLAGIDPQSLLFLPDGTLIFSTSSIASDPGIYHMPLNASPTKIHDDIGRIEATDRGHFAGRIFVQISESIVSFELEGQTLGDRRTVVQDGICSYTFGNDGELYIATKTDIYQVITGP